MLIEIRDADAGRSTPPPAPDLGSAPGARLKMLSDLFRARSAIRAIDIVSVASCTIKIGGVAHGHTWKLDTVLRLGMRRRLRNHVHDSQSGRDVEQRRRIQWHMGGSSRNVPVQ